MACSLTTKCLINSSQLDKLTIRLMFKHTSITIPHSHARRAYIIKKQLLTKRWTWFFLVYHLGLVYRYQRVGYTSVQFMNNGSPFKHTISQFINIIASIISLFSVTPSLLKRRALLRWMFVGRVQIALSSTGNPVRYTSMALNGILLKGSRAKRQPQSTCNVAVNYWNAPVRSQYRDYPCMYIYS